MDEKKVKISVRNLVEFILRSGDIDISEGGISDVQAMQAGTRIHKKLQKQMGAGYSSEVMLRITVPYKKEQNHFQITVEGRADGIFQKDGRTVIDEIKGVYRDVSLMKEPISVHLSQAMCYAYIYALEKELKEIAVRMTYCNLDTEEVQYFEELYTKDFLDKWFTQLIQEYGKWISWQEDWKKRRNIAIKKQEFPFLYRTGQRELVMDVYRSIIRGKKLYIEAPTGTGKTMATVFPAIKAMGEEKAEKIFYLTAKTITRTVAEHAVELLMQQETKLKVITITAKEKICILEKPECNPYVCPRAKGHYDRVNDAVFDMLVSEESLDRGIVEAYAEKHNVCPFELCLDAAVWVDMIICDYNYVFDPNAYLRRFFAEESKKEYLFLIDEAHNLVSRAREMYSAVLYKKDFMEIRRLVKPYGKRLEKQLGICNKDLVALKKQCDSCEICRDISGFVFHLMTLSAELELFLQSYRQFEYRDKVLEFYFYVRNFLNIYDFVNEKYLIYTAYEAREFYICLRCMDPSDNLESCLRRGKAAVFFSATLLPIQYYKEQLAGKSEDYAIYAPSSFDKQKRLLMIANDVSTKYTRRTASEYEKIASYIQTFVSVKQGNYFVFFPSYQYMEEVASYITITEEKDVCIYIQKQSMREEEKEAFLEYFVENPHKTNIGFCVMGGIFGEGIDLKKDRLIGSIIVGTGLPMICEERELLRNYFEEKNRKGFEYAYLYDGMNKVQQAAGRVIRTEEDRGVILLLDERFRKEEYARLFPHEWFPNKVVNEQRMKKELEEFWDNDRNDKTDASK